MRTGPRRDELCGRMTRELESLPGAAIVSRILFGVLVACAACSPASGKARLAQPDGERFALEVYPVLLRDCGMSQCHGAEARFFRVFGPGRTRLSAKTDPLEGVLGQEVLESYQRASALLEDRRHPERSLLLRKPLAPAAGGATHKGSDRYGHDIYGSKADPGYVVLERWAREVALAEEESP